MGLPAPPRTDDPRERDEWFLEVQMESSAADSRVLSGSVNTSAVDSKATSNATSLSVAVSRIDSAHP